MDSKTRAEIRARANREEAIFQIGKGGINDNLVTQVNDALKAREIVKLTVLETAPEAPKEAAARLAEALNAEVIQTIGYKIVLYRKNPEKAAERKPVKKAAKPKRDYKKTSASGYGNMSGKSGRYSSDERKSYSSGMKSTGYRDKSSGHRSTDSDKRYAFGGGDRQDGYKYGYDKYGESKRGSYENRVRYGENKGKAYGSRSVSSDKKGYGRSTDKKSGYVKTRANSVRTKSNKGYKTDYHR